MCRRQEGYQVTKAYTFDDIWALGPCWSEHRLRQAIDVAGGSVTAAQIAQASRATVSVPNKVWVLTQLLAHREVSALIAWVWRRLAEVSRDCPHWRAMLEAPGDKHAAYAAHAAADFDCANRPLGDAYYTTRYAGRAAHFAGHVAGAAADADYHWAAGCAAEAMRVIASIVAGPHVSDHNYGPYIDFCISDIVTILEAL